MILAFFKNAKIIIMFTNFITINHVMNYERLKKKKKLWSLYIYHSQISVQRVAVKNV